MKLCFFCGAKDGNNSKHMQLVEDMMNSFPLGTEVIYGGAQIGIMGKVADAAIKKGLSVTGIMPGALIPREVAHNSLTTFINVASMHERKQLMYDSSDAFIILPGGFGTMDEMFEILTWKQLGHHQKKIIIYNMEGFFDPLITFMKHATASGFVLEKDLKMVDVAQNLADLKKILSY